MTDRCYASARTRNLPLILSSALGIVSFTLFSLLPTPESVAAFIYAALAGASQIGAIVCSLGLLSRGIVEAVEEVPRSHLRTPNEDGDELDALLETVEEEDTRESFKGSIAGVYSLFGGAAILLLTKVGGKAFDGAVGAPFWMLAAFNAALGVVAVAVGVLGKR